MVKKGLSLPIAQAKTWFRGFAAMLFCAVASLQIQNSHASNLFSKGKEVTRSLYTELRDFSVYAAGLCAVCGVLGFMIFGQRKGEKAKDYAIKAVLCYITILVLGYIFITAKDLAGGAPDVMSL
ncbi:hypothetical protein M2146_001054 [Lachnospiraceae bacterium PF1-22]